MIELGKADIMRSGIDVTVVGWGGQLRVLEKVMKRSCGCEGLFCVSSGMV